ERSPRVRQLLGVAEAEARRFGHSYIGQEHLLLALAQDMEGNAGAILNALGASPEKVRQAVLYIVGRGVATPVAGGVGRTPRAKKALALAVAEARTHGQPFLSTQHVLLGLAEEGTGVGAGVLTSLGVSVAKVRAQADARDPDGNRQASLSADAVREAAQK